MKKKQRPTLRAGAGAGADGGGGVGGGGAARDDELNFQQPHLLNTDLVSRLKNGGRSPYAEFTYSSVTVGGYLEPHFGVM